MLALLLNGCSAQPSSSPRDVADANDTGRTLVPQTPSERLLLEQLSQLPNGTARRVGDASVIAEAPYSAASGHTCRAVTLASSQSRKATRRLACSNEGHWFFVPDIFAGQE